MCMVRRHSGGIYNGSSFVHGYYKFRFLFLFLLEGSQKARER